MSRRIIYITVLAALLTLWSTWQGSRTFDSVGVGIDDANISMVYGRHLAEGEGFVYTPGSERVEGFTSLGWVLIMAGTFLGSDTPEGILLAISIVLCTVTVTAVLHILLLLFDRRPGAADPASDQPRLRSALAVLVGLAWLAGQPGFFVWNTITLMDLVLWTTLLHLAVWVIVRDTADATRRPGNVWWLGGLVAALALTRPESMVVAPGLIALAVLLQGVADGEWRAALRRFAPAAAILVGTVAALTVFRLWYFGYPLPNTYYAKISPDRFYNLMEGAHYVGRFFRDYQRAAIPLVGAAVAVVAFGLVAVWRRRRTDAADRIALGTAAVVLGGISLPLAVGGDHFGSFRFIQPYIPLMIVPAAYAAHRVIALRPYRPSLRGLLAAGGLVAVAGTAWSAYAWRRFPSASQMANEFDIAREGREVGDALNAMFPNDPPTIADVRAGGVGYAYDGRFYDLSGLNWTAMGHSPGDRHGVRNHAAFNPDVFWTAEPDIVMPERTTEIPDSADAIVHFFFREILADLLNAPRFQNAYQAGYLREDSTSVVTGFFSRAWLEVRAEAAFTPLP